MKHRASAAMAVVTVCALTACAAPPPAAPSFLAAPGQGKNADQFRADDANCRTQANAANGGVSPAEGAQRSGLGSAALGTALGAAAGALIGAAGHAAGVGAAIGAGVGLLAGTSSAGPNAAASGDALQRNYDNAYAQCMVTAGNTVPTPPQFAGAPAGVPVGYAYPAYPYAYPPYPGYAYASPSVVVGFGGGYWHHW